MKLSDAQALAESLMIQHRLLFPDHGIWTFHWMDRANICGRCERGTKRILLSKYYVEHNSDDDIRNTILHEIAHAICPVSGHGRLWKLTAISVGARPRTCAPEHIAVKPGRYRGTCTDCQEVVVQRHKISKYIVTGCHHRNCRRKPNNGAILWTDTKTGKKIGHRHEIQQSQGSKTQG
jgi:predicted SprT family Zn-dependent metalloprotease